MPKYGYLVVEGPHDVEFAYRLLSSYGLRRVHLLSKLDQFFTTLVPTTFPPDDDLQKRVPVPLFAQNDTHVVAVHSAIGDTRLVQSFEESNTQIDFRELMGAGVILDSDEEPPANRTQELSIKLKQIGLDFPTEPGTVIGNAPKKGIYVLPDNTNCGNLEDLLLECADNVYPACRQRAETYADAAANDGELDGEDLAKHSFKKKAIVGSIASVLRPGKAVQASIQDNKWLRGLNLDLPRIRAVRDFLNDLFELSTS